MLKTDYYLSPQMNDLVDFIRSYKEPQGESNRIIIFVQQRSFAVGLALLINDIFSSDVECKTIAAYITGKRSSMSLGADDSFHNPKDIVSSFRNGAVNIIVTTSAIDDFVDIPRHTFFILFFPNKTSSVLRQMNMQSLSSLDKHLIMCQKDPVDNNEGIVGSTTEFNVERAISDTSTEMEEEIFSVTDDEDSDDISSCSDYEEYQGIYADGDLDMSEAKNGRDSIDYFSTHLPNVIVTINSAVTIFFRYCKYINFDGRKDLPPKFYVEKRCISMDGKNELVSASEAHSTYSDSFEYRFSTQIVTSSKLETVHGIWHLSESESKKSACFEACRVLYNIGILQTCELLRPKKFQSGSIICENEFKYILRQDHDNFRVDISSFKTLKSAISLRSLPWSLIESRSKMYLYSFSHSLDPDANFGVLSVVDLAEVIFENDSFEFFNDREIHKISMKFIKTEEICIDELKIIQDCFGALISSTLTAENVEIFMSPTKEMSPLLVVPMRSDLSSSNECHLDWEEINRVYRELLLYRESRTIIDEYKDFGLNRLQEIMETRFVISDIARGKLQIRGIIDRGVEIDNIFVHYVEKEQSIDDCVVLNESVECNSDLNPPFNLPVSLSGNVSIDSESKVGTDDPISIDVVASDSVPGICPLPKFIEKHKLNMHFDETGDVPIILYKRLPSYRHLRYLRLTDNRKHRTREALLLSEKLVRTKVQTSLEYEPVNNQYRLNLITLSDLSGYLDRSLSAAKVHPVKLKSICGLSPSILLLAHIEHSSIVLDCKRLLIPTFSDMKLLRLALTTPSCERQFSYERLETIGDSLLKLLSTMYLLLKYPRYSEGRLTIKKANLINNTFLQKRATRSKLLQFIISSKIVHRRFLPLGYRPNSASNTCDRNDLGDKTVSDIIESLIGSLYFDSNESMQSVWENILCAFKVVPRFAPYPDISVIYRSRKNISSFRQHIEDVEEILGYNFKFPELAVEALTHPSFDKLESTLNYQRFEFLGDSLLDFVITRYLYLYDSSLDPADITNWRSSVVCNENLGLIAVRSGLYRYIIHRSDTISASIRWIESKSALDASLQNISKVFGDVVESLIAAVFIDCDGELKIVIDLVNRFIIRDYLDPKLQQVPHHPVSIFHEMVASCRCSDIEFDYYQVNEKRVEKGLSDSNDCRELVSCSIKIHGTSICIGRGTNRKAAKKQACQTLLGSKNEFRRKFMKQLKSLCRCVYEVGRDDSLPAEI
jgi:dsRNA-specific ribonuclease